MAENKVTAVAWSPLPDGGRVGGAPASLVSDSNPDLAQYDVMSNPGRSGVRPLFAITSYVGINQSRVPLRNVLILQLQLLTRRMRRVDNEYVRPLDEPF